MISPKQTRISIPTVQQKQQKNELIPVHDSFKDLHCLISSSELKSFLILLTMTKHWIL